MTKLVFTSSDAFMDADARAVERLSVTVTDYVECTYSALRSGPDGDEIAAFTNGAWELPEGHRFSDWSVSI